MTCNILDKNRYLNILIIIIIKGILMTCNILLQVWDPYPCKIWKIGNGSPPVWKSPIFSHFKTEPMSDTWQGHNPKITKRARNIQLLSFLKSLTSYSLSPTSLTLLLCLSSSSPSPPPYEHQRQRN